MCRRIVVLVTFLLLSIQAYAQQQSCPPLEIEKLVVAAATIDNRCGTPVKVSDLRSLLDVFNRLTTTANVHPKFLLIPSDIPNAFGSEEFNSIAITSKMLDAIIAGNKDVAAAILGHEIGHIALRHDTARRKNDDALKKITPGQLASPEIPLEVVQAVFHFAYKREMEFAADTFGTRLASEAGFSPDGVNQAMERAYKLFGDEPTGYFSTHPSWRDRYARQQPIIANEVNKGAETLIQKKEWKNLNVYAAKWISRLPTPYGKGWYYRGIALNQLRRAGSVEAFERAVTVDPELRDAWMELCIGLYEEGYRRESAHCSRYIPRGELQDEYQAKTFGIGHVFSGGAEPPTYGDVCVSKDADGKKKFTNIFDAGASCESPAVPIPPSWRAVRYKPSPLDASLK